MLFRNFALVVTLLLTSPSLADDANKFAGKLPGDKMLGSDKAKIVMVEYASLSCPHCAGFHATVLPKIEEKYISTGKVKFIFRDYPLNPSALAGAQIAHCAAAKKGDKAYFDALKKLFASQAEWAFGNDFAPKLVAMAKDFGLDEKKANACLNDKKLEEKIFNTVKAGTDNLKVKSTPAVFVNGKPTRSLQEIEAAIAAVK